MRQDILGKSKYNVSLCIDVAFCCILLPLQMYAFPVERWWGTYPLFFCSFMVWLYATFFLYKYYIVPRLFANGKKRTMALVVMLLSIVVTYILSMYKISSPLFNVHQEYRRNHPYPVWGMRLNEQAVWIHYILVVFFCFTVGLLKEMYRQKLARTEVEYQRNKAELSLYKAQINPHFFFNTLNTIYGLLITHSDKTEVTLESFINLTKYLYNNANREYIPLKEEVDYIGQYIALQQLRLNENADVRFTHEVEHADMPIPPMMLITFVENAFKYGVSADEPCFIHIRLTQQTKRLVFEVVNSTFSHLEVTSSRTGINNCIRRLELLYPERHRLDIGKSDDGQFRVLLEIMNN